MRDFGSVKFSMTLNSNKMIKISESFMSRRGFLRVSLIVSIIVIIGNQNAHADEVPAFFLKIAKNIPRIGRSSPTIEYFEENSKANDPTYGVSKRKIGFSPETDTWAWQHFPLAIEGPPELWRTLAGYSHDPLYRTSEDFNNELWSRDKRTSN